MSNEELKTIAPVRTISLKNDVKMRYFDYRKLNFIWKQEKKEFIKAEYDELV